eukprot:GHRR01034132.1.p1 GENE.GHRR01034132.1~~GHRR01034132.1.p1  ORF type:complete len:371 (+),score=118.78 GHRR01034132.1:562-1674(+)
MDVSAALPAPVSDAQAQVAVASANAPPAGSAAPALAGATAPAPSAAVASAAFTAQPAAPKAPAALGVPPPTNHQQQHPAPRPTVEQCRVLQQVIRLLENHEDAKKMVPLASMSPDMLQVTLANSPQPINVSDVLSKLIPHLDPVQAAQLWEQFRRGAAIAGPGSGNMAQAAGALQHSLSGAGCGSAGHLAAAASGGSGDFAAAVNQALPLAPGALNPAHAKLKRQAFAANGSKCSTCGETYHPSYSPLVLCDFCPSAHHVYCLGLDWPDLPEGEWACPRYVDRVTAYIGHLYQIYLLAWPCWLNQQWGRACKFLTACFILLRLTESWHFVWHTCCKAYFLSPNNAYSTECAQWHNCWQQPLAMRLSCIMV